MLLLYKPKPTRFNIKINQHLILLWFITFHVTWIWLRLQVELSENGLWVSAGGAQRRLDGVVQSLLKPSRFQLSSVRISHYLWEQRDEGSAMSQQAGAVYLRSSIHALHQSSRWNTQQGKLHTVPSKLAADFSSVLIFYIYIKHKQNIYFKDASINCYLLKKRTVLHKTHHAERQMTAEMF